MHDLLIKQDKLNQIIDDIFKLNEPKIEESRKSQISEFVKSTINGDNPDSYLAINANFNENASGATLFILTDLRLIRVDITTKEIQSSSFPLNTIIGIHRKLIDDKSEFSITFKDGSFRLRYPYANQQITDFFQKIEQKRPSNV